MFRDVCIHAIERKVTGVLMVTVEIRSKFMGLWMRLIPVGSNNATLPKVKGIHFYFDGWITNASILTEIQTDLKEVTVLNI
jgi:hypothetical protein